MNCALSINQLRALSTKLDIEESNAFDSILSTFIIYEISRFWLAAPLSTYKSTHNPQFL